MHPCLAGCAGLRSHICPLHTLLQTNCRDVVALRLRATLPAVAPVAHPSSILAILAIKIAAEIAIPFARLISARTEVAAYRGNFAKRGNGHGTGVGG